MPDNSLPPLPPKPKEEATPTTATPNSSKDEQPKKSSNFLFTAIVIFLVVAILGTFGFIVYTLMTNEESDSKGNNKQTPQEQEYSNSDNPKPTDALPTATFCQTTRIGSALPKVCLQLINGWVSTTSSEESLIAFTPQAQTGSSTAENEKVILSLTGKEKEGELDDSYQAYKTTLCATAEVCTENIKIFDKINKGDGLYAELENNERKFIVVSFQTETQSWNASASIPLAQVDQFHETLKYSIKSIEVK